ncbi:transcriptional adapter 2-alpha-like isoform X2 [Odontomachus brunneus]|uniref:transcriptional adapter 2-alpha-like isoform X2 n=1 Tax=Odontomachus brunneus TaxID=486640 RepID=UPI0013F1E17A|nr:transcriptional adapter 2-alpha-like isoform X2 [Odontomachus brunneus]
MANPNLTDMTEEDAADLQFPKDYDPLSETSKSECDVDLEVSVLKDEIPISDPTCRVCKSTLVEPYVRCAVCVNVEICLPCFAKGCEIDTHKNDHNYMIIKNEFPLFDSGWSAMQETKLLDLMLQCGFGNWSDISHAMGRTAKECKQHYLQHYVDNQTLPDLPKLKENRTSLFSCDPIPFLYKLQDLDEPPRFAPDTANGKLVAGYNAARSDFEVNFDNDAESLVADLDLDDFQPDDNMYELGRALQVAMVQVYNNRLKERMRRYEIIRRHGLIALRKINSWIKRFDNTIPRAERLLIFMQLMDGMDFDYIMEGLHHVGELKNNINTLLEFRRNGLTHFHSVSMFQNLTKMRQENERERKQYLNNPEYSWKSVLPGYITNSSNPIPGTSLQRKVAPPLSIKSLPGYEKLTFDERELCSVARIVPSSYIDFKHLLIAENKKSGSLKLAQARALLKIDVNKTRKIYDFLAEEGYINKPTS